MEIVTKLETNSPEETFEIGKRIGESAAPGSVFTLIGDLGVGKTVFTQGVAKGLGIEGPVSSPTFTILQVYDEGRLPFYHFDVYRIGDVSEMDEIGYEDYFYGGGVCFIEWANLIEAQCAYSLITGKHNGVFLIPDIMLQMMTDTSAFTHSARSYNDFGNRLVFIQRLRFF